MPALPDAILLARSQTDQVYRELNSLFFEMNDPRDQAAKAQVAESLDALDEILTQLNREGIEAGNPQARNLLKAVQSSQAGLHHLQQELQHIAQNIGKIGTVVSVLSDALSGFQSLAGLLV